MTEFRLQAVGNLGTSFNNSDDEVTVVSVQSRTERSTKYNRKVPAGGSLDVKVFDRLTNRAELSHVVVRRGDDEFEVRP